MSYFDSPKNRAFWERRLSTLREERDRRSRTGYVPQQAAKEQVKAAAEENPFRTRITFAELEREEAERTSARRAARRPERSLSAQKSKGAAKEQEPLKNGRQL